MRNQDELKQALTEVPELSGGLMDLLRNEGFRTGSSVYSSAKPMDEDWCINVPTLVFQGYALDVAKNWRDDDKLYWDENNPDGMGVIYAHRYGTIMNIMCFADYQMMMAWYHTTIIMNRIREMNVPKSLFWARRFDESISLTDVFDEKWKRVRVFRAIKDILAPHKPLNEPLSPSEAWDRNCCRICGKEAINFIDQVSRKDWEIDLICDRCRK